MTKAKKLSKKPAVSGDLSPPRWMSRAEKSNFRRLIEARKAAGRPVLSTELDLVSDYISARSRITLLRKMAKVAVQQCRDPHDTYGLHPFGYEAAQRHAMLLMRQCQSATMHSRRLARDLGLIDDSP